MKEYLRNEQRNHQELYEWLAKIQPVFLASQFLIFGPFKKENDKTNSQNCLKASASRRKRETTIDVAR